MNIKSTFNRTSIKIQWNHKMSRQRLSANVCMHVMNLLFIVIIKHVFCCSSLSTRFNVANMFNLSTWIMILFSSIINIYCCSMQSSTPEAPWQCFQNVSFGLNERPWFTVCHREHPILVCTSAPRCSSFVPFLEAETPLRDYFTNISI